MIGLLFQTSVLLNDYLRGKTITTVSIEMVKFEQVPAITLCLNDWLSMEKLENHPYHSESNEISMNF